METRKTVFEKIALNSEKYDFALVDELNRSINSISADISMIKEAEKNSNKLYTALVKTIPDANERTKTNEQIYKSALKKYQSALDTQLKFRKAAQELGIEATSNNDYNKLVDELMDYKKSIEDIRNVNDLLKRIL